MLELSVNAKTAVSITAAFKKIQEMIRTGSVARETPVHITLEPGIYSETIKYNLSNPLIMESVPGTKATDCVIQAENCEAFHKGAENRSVFAIGPNVKSITLKNFTIINKHKKSIAEGNTAGDSAEALTWDNTNGTLVAENMRFLGHQNVMYLKGSSRFSNCFISGDVDVIYGSANTALFEECEINLCEDPRGDYNAYAVKSIAPKDKNGFVFSECTFTGEKRKKSALYVMRTAGKGSASSLLGWDSVALLNCKVSYVYDEEFSWDDDHSLDVYPRANANVGWREYKTKIIEKNGSLVEADTSRRNVKSYLLTENDFFNGYASRFLILHDTPFAVEK